MTDLPSIPEQQRYWDQRWKSTPTPNAWQVRRGETIMEFIRQLSLERPRILDMGCGTGWFTEALSHVGQVTGIDLSEEAIAIARASFPGVDFVAGDVYRLPCPAGTFDLLVSQEVIAHVEDQPAYLDLAAQWLKPGGHMIITTVNRFVHERQEWAPSPEGHIETWLDKRDLHRLLQPRFQVLDTTTILPMGDKGVLRFVNSRWLHRFLRLFVAARTIEGWKEAAGFGWCIVCVASKRP